MAQQKEQNKNIRKLTRVGRGSISVTIPVEMVKQLKWKERQKVVLSLKNKKITIQDWPKTWHSFYKGIYCIYIDLSDQQVAISSGHTNFTLRTTKSLIFGFVYTEIFCLREPQRTLTPPSMLNRNNGGRKNLKIRIFLSFSAQ